MYYFTPNFLMRRMYSGRIMLNEVAKMKMQLFRHIMEKGELEDLMASEFVE